MEPGGEHGGERVVLTLFAILAACVVVVFTVFSFYLREGELRAKMVPIVLRNLYLPVVATSLLVSIDAWRRGRSGWWVYFVTAPVPGVNVALAVLWLRRWRDAPRPWWRWTL